MQDFAMKIITSGTTLAELGRDCHTQAMVCHPRRARCRSASALYTAPHVSPPRSCTRLRHRGIHIAPPACFGLPSICHILPLQARTQSAVQSYLSFVDRFGGEGAASEPGGFKASAGPPPAAGMLCCYSERCKGAPKAAEAFSATQRKANKNKSVRRCKVCIADQVGQLEKPLFGDECRHTRQTTLTTLKVVAPIGPSAGTAAAVELSPSAQSTQALPPAWPAWRFCNLDKTLVCPSNANIQKVLKGFHRIAKPMLMSDMARRSPGRTCSSDGTFRLMSRTITDANVLVLIIGDDHCIVAYYVVRAEMWADLVPGLEGLRNRLSRLGTLHLLQEWWSDRQSFSACL